MIIKPYELNKIDNNSNFFLFYGKNEGLKTECIENLLKKNKEKNVFSYDEKQIQEEKENFFENILSVTLFEKNISRDLT